MHRTRLLEAIRIALPLWLGLAALLSVSYVNEQQILRGDANEPQMSMAEDLAAGLSASATTTLASPEPIAIETSLSPYLVVYDSYGDPIDGTGFLHGQLPMLPSGIFDVVRGSGEDALTWQPEAGVRSAIVVVPINDGAGGFVMGGRSLRYVEYQEDKLTERTFLGLIAILIATFVGAYLATYIKK